MFLLWNVISQFFFLFSVHYALCLQLLLFLHGLRPPTNIYNNEIICHLNRKIENQFSTFHKSVMVWVCCPTFLYNQSCIGWTAKEIDYEPPWTSKGGWKNILKVNFSLSFKRLCLIYLSILSYHYVLRKKMISLKRSFQSQQQTSLSKQIGGCSVGQQGFYVYFVFFLKSLY